jgi:hypothetical protein
MYDPRVGRFLSLDPLIKDYPAWSPFPFAMNNPVEGTDLDGKEYLSSKNATIQLINGSVILKVSNLHEVTRNLIQAKSEDTKNWASGQIGINIQVGSLYFDKIKAETDADIGNIADVSYGAPNPSEPLDEMKIQNPIAKSTGLPDQRYKERAVNISTPAVSRGTAVLSVAIDAIIAGAWLWEQHEVDNDLKTAKSQTIFLKKAAYDVGQAMKGGDIPESYQTEGLLSAITNFVLSGDNTTDDPKVADLGKLVFTKYSMQRFGVLGIDKTTTADGQVILTLKPNPSYNPEYEKQEKASENNDQQTNNQTTSSNP